jgi:hypothetical protein
VTLAEFIDTAKLDLDAFEDWAQGQKLGPRQFGNWLWLFKQHHLAQLLPKVPGYQESEP